MRCLNLVDQEFNLAKKDFDHFVRVDNIFICSKITRFEQISLLKEWKVQLAIDLKEIGETNFNDREEFESQGINYFHFPIKNLDCLTFDQLREFEQIVRSQRGNIVIYCQSGNRVSALLALSMCLICGHPKKRSLEFGIDIGMKNPKTQDAVKKILMGGWSA